MRKIIYVPQNAADMKSDWLGDENIEEYSWKLNDSEFRNLLSSGVFEYFNRLNKIGKIKLNYCELDEFEEDFICYQYLYFNYDEIIIELKKFSCNNEIVRLIELIDRAIECRTVIIFNL
ncbi:MAG: hypothetical protein NC485_04235 [Ruminococcus flavefaciens]|nr:hypothetical protein [Ruminococcus flavefaciens]MCM1058942.1 hypothetical protein [Eubacterium sp.]